MIELEIINIKNNTYMLQDKDKKKYILNLEFFDIENKPKIGDCINISSELLDPRYVEFSTNYIFGSLDSKYGRKCKTLTDIDIIKLRTDESEIYLKRLYG